MLNQLKKDGLDNVHGEEVKVNKMKTKQNNTCFFKVYESLYTLVSKT